MSQLPTGGPAPDDDPLLKSRVVPLVMMLGAAALFAANHAYALNQGQVFIAVPLLAPFVFLLGVAGLIDPRITWAIGPRGQHLPAWIKAIGIALLVVGLAIGGLLLVYVYRFLG